MTNRKQRRTVSQDGLSAGAAAADLFEAFGDSTRRAIVQLLHERPYTVGELAERLPVSRPAVSQHVKVLREARLVLVHTEGTRHIVSLDPSGLAALREYLDELWKASLPSLARLAEDTPATAARR